MSRKSYVFSLVGVYLLALGGAAQAQGTNGDSPTGSSTQKGSLVILSKIEIKWDESGEILLQDTFLDLSNDYPGDVYVQGYYINGDVELQQRCSDEQCDPPLQEYEPGWNTADCRFRLTANEPTYWSAAYGGKCQSFVSLDGDGPGRLVTEADGVQRRVLRGYAIFYAVKFIQNGNVAGSIGEWQEIRWNHLKGDAVIVDYEHGQAWEYNGWSFRAFGLHKELVADATWVETPHGAPLGTPNELKLDGYEYEAGYEELIFDFYRTGSVALSSDNETVMLDTDLTVHALGADLRQDGCGPILTKIVADIWDEGENKRSGTERCVCCWDQTMLQNWASNTNFFRNLGTDKGKARLRSDDSILCDVRALDLCGETALIKRYFCERPVPPIAGGGPVFPGFSEIASVLGLATKFLAFSPSQKFASAGMNLVGAGDREATIWVDPSDGPEEIVGDTGRTVSKDDGVKDRTGGIRTSVGRDVDVRPGE